MKTILTTSLLLICFFCFAQDQMPRNASGKIEWVEVVKADSLKADQLFSNARLYITNIFNSGKTVTELADVEGKTIVAKGKIPVTVRAMGMNWEGGTVEMKITIQCKDGRYRYSFTEFDHENKLPASNNSGGALENEKPSCGGMKMTKKQWAGIKETVNSTVATLISKLKTDMAGNTASNW